MTITMLIDGIADNIRARRARRLAQQKSWNHHRMARGQVASPKMPYPLDEQMVAYVQKTVRIMEGLLARIDQGEFAQDTASPVALTPCFLLNVYYLPAILAQLENKQISSYGFIIAGREIIIQSNRMIAQREGCITLWIQGPAAHEYIGPHWMNNQQAVVYEQLRRDGVGDVDAIDAACACTRDFRWRADAALGDGEAPVGRHQQRSTITA